MNDHPQAGRPPAAGAAQLHGGAALAVFLAGVPQQASLGAILLLAGVALVACPPQVRVQPVLGALVGVLVGVLVGALVGVLATAGQRPEAWRYLGGYFPVLRSAPKK